MYQLVVMVLVLARGPRVLAPSQPTQPQGLSLHIDREFQRQVPSTITNGVAEEDYLRCDHPWYSDVGNR